MKDEEIINAITNNKAYREGKTDAVRFRHIAEVMNVNPNSHKESQQLDRALQRLRRSNVIAYSHKDGWMVL